MRHPIKYRMGFDRYERNWHLVRKSNGRALCGASRTSALIEVQWCQLEASWSAMSQRGNGYCQECGRRDANNGLPLVPQENSTNREAASQGTEDTLWIEPTLHANETHNSYSVGYPGGRNAYITRRDYDQLNSESLSRIGQALNSEEARRSGYSRASVFVRAIQTELSRIRENEARVQRQRPGRTGSYTFVNALNDELARFRGSGW